MTSKLNILIGDDEFRIPFEKEDFEVYYGNKIIDSLKADLDFASSSRECIEKGLSGKYDCVVTDLNYEEGTKKEGFDVIDELSALDEKPLLILCTSTDQDLQEITERVKGKADYVVGPAFGDEIGWHKFDYLVEALESHYLGD